MRVFRLSLIIFSAIIMTGCKNDTVECEIGYINVDGSCVKESVNSDIDLSNYELIYQNDLEDIKIYNRAKGSYTGMHQVVYENEQKIYSFPYNDAAKYVVVREGVQYSLDELFMNEWLSDEELLSIEWDSTLFITERDSD